MKSTIKLGFASDLVPLVLNCTKFLTYRLGTKYEVINIGDTVEIFDASTNQSFGEIEILDKYQTTFGELPVDQDGHEKYASKDEMRLDFRRHYHIEVSDNDTFLVFRFKLIKTPAP